MNKKSTALRPDAQAFDEIRILTVPRYKQSGLSGDEWRISAEVRLYRKGELCHSASFSTIEHACGFLYSTFQSAIEDGKAFFAGDGVHCDQEGCSNLRSVEYRILKRFCGDGQEHEMSRPMYRYFCEKHKKRGNCGLDDSDRNYELVSSQTES